MADNHNQLLKDLIGTISKDNITGETIKEIEKSNLWKELLEFMKQEGGSSLLGHYPIFQSDFKNNTLFKFINATADMDSNESPAGSFNFKAILDNLRNKVNPDGSANTYGDNPWNESLTNSLTYLLRYIDPEYVRDYENKHQISYKPDKDKETNLPKEVNNTNGSIPVKGSSLNGGFRITDVKNANAGNSFTNDGERPWVIPNYNVDSDTYDKVRGIDKILQVLTSHKEMQFTHTQSQTDSEKNNQIDNPTSGVSKYIRLLMPKYLRRVEVEDLNRNFWVIGQVLAAISAYLFDEDSPVTQMFKRILSELIQLWENILYLWAAVMLVSQKPYYTKVHTEVVYIPNDSYRDYWKYDNFQATRTTDLKTIWTNRLQYLKDSYPECHLCILPIVRGGNYRHNYYSTETWPGVILYNRNTDVVSYHNFNLTISASDSNIKSRCYFIREEGNNYLWGYPFSNVKNSAEDNPAIYYNAIRTIPISIVTNFSPDNNLLTVSNCVIGVYDAAASVVNEKSQIKILDWSAANIKETDTTSVSLSQNNLIAEYDNLSPKINKSVIDKGIYFGELLSNTISSAQVIYELNIHSIPMQPLAGNDFQLSTYQAQDARGLSEWAKTSPSYGEGKNVFTLALAMRQYDNWGDKNKDYTYWGLKNGKWGWQTVSMKQNFASRAYTSAMLHNSLTDSNIPYDSWSYMIDRGWSLGYSDKNDGYTGWDNNQTFIYIENGDSGLSSNNWCIRYVQAVGVQAIVDSSKNITRTDLNDETFDKYDKTTYGLCTAIKVTLFYHDGTFATRTYYHNRNSEGNALVSGWKNIDEKGRYNSSTYATDRATLNQNYTLFRGARYDYEAHHRNGTNR